MASRVMIDSDPFTATDSDAPGIGRHGRRPAALVAEAAIPAYTIEFKLDRAFPRGAATAPMCFFVRADGTECANRLAMRTSSCAEPLRFTRAPPFSKTRFYTWRAARYAAGGMPRTPLKAREK